MRIQNKYYRNRIARQKHWGHCRSKSHPYETHMPYSFYGSITPGNSTEDQIESHFEWIGKRARAMESGVHKGFFHATSSFRRTINRQNKAKIRNAMKKINLGDYDTIIPIHKRDADWLYF